MTAITHEVIRRMGEALLECSFGVYLDIKCVEKHGVIELFEKYGLIRGGDATVLGDRCAGIGSLVATDVNFNRVNRDKAIIGLGVMALVNSALHGVVSFDDPIVRDTLCLAYKDKWFWELVIVASPYGVDVSELKRKMQEYCG